MDDMSAMSTSLPADMTSTNPILAKLTALSIPHTSYAHTLSTTTDELLANVPLSSPSTETHTKNLFFKDKKHGLFLVTTATETEMNTKELGRLLKLEGKVNLRLADEDLLECKLGCKKGCVGPMAIMNNSDEKDVTLVLDESLMGMEKVHSHPMRNDVSVSLSPNDLMAFLKGVGCEPVIVAFPKSADGGAVLGGKVPSSRPDGDKGASKPKIAKKDPGAPKSANVNKKQTKKGE
jgi:Ala-tRNA(Pro) deacylase